MELTRKKLTVLVTGSDAPGFSSIVRSLRISKKYNFKIVGTDWKRNLKAEFFADVSYVLPDNRTPEFVTELLEVCKKEKVDFILPIRTDDQLHLCENLREFDKIGTTPLIITPNYELMETAINKYKMLEYLRNVASLETMNYFLVKTKDDLEKSMYKLGYPDKPVAIKPAHATGSRGFRVVDNSIDRKKIFFNEKPTSTYITKADLLTILGDNFTEMLVMEYLEEPEYTVDVLCYKGKVFAKVPRKRLKMSGGITVKGIIEQLPKITEKYIEKIIEAFGFSYSVGLQFRRSTEDEKKYHLLEINPRLQGTTVISVAAGVNFPEHMISMGLREFDFSYKPEIKYGLLMERTYHELFYNHDKVRELD